MNECVELGGRKKKSGMGVFNPEKTECGNPWQFVHARIYPEIDPEVLNLQNIFSLLSSSL